MRKILLINFGALLIFLCLFFPNNVFSGKVTKTLCKHTFPSDETINWYCYQFKKDEIPEMVFGKYWEWVLRFNRIDRRHIRPGTYLKVPYNLTEVVGFTPLPFKLEEAKQYQKYVLIDLSEQFLGCYEWGELRFSFPIASGRKSRPTPKGMFRVLGRDKNHYSSLYTITGTRIPYPMFWGIKFYVTKKHVSFWIHSRDLPGYPVSHGCIGLYDEEMQKRFYGFPENPKLLDAKILYLWLFPEGENDKEPYDYPEDAPEIPIEIR